MKQQQILTEHIKKKLPQSQATRWLSGEHTGFLAQTGRKNKNPIEEP